jgi:HEPN domain-containing protein
MNRLVQESLQKADEDRRSAHILLRDTEPLVTPAMFHLQQNAEKLLKALLVKKKITFERRHDLTYLLHLSTEPALLEHLQVLNELNPFAVELRYPGDYPVISVTNALGIEQRLEAFRSTLLPLIIE